MSRSFDILDYYSITRPEFRKNRKFLCYTGKSWREDYKENNVWDDIPHDPYTANKKNPELLKIESGAYRRKQGKKNTVQGSQ